MARQAKTETATTVPTGLAVGQELTLERAKTLKNGDILHHALNVNADNTPQRWKVTSVKTWKTQPERIRIGLKHGLYAYGSINETELHLLRIPV